MGESQKMKNEYKQMLLHTMEEQTDEEVEFTPESQDRSQARKRIHFMMIGSSQANCIEEEADDY